MKEFILLIRLGIAPLSQEQTEQLRQEWGKLTTRLREEKKFIDGYIFSPEGFTVMGPGATSGITTVNGLQAAGFVMLFAENMDEVLQIARECPPLNVGGTVEVRQRQPTPIAQPVSQ